ncbi:MAG: peptidylprolyl isomerase [Patescibacteria group bacterium]
MVSQKSIIILLVVCGALIALLALWERNINSTPELLLEPAGEGEPLAITSPLTPEEAAVVDPVITNTMNPTVTFATNQGAISLEIFADVMPITAGNFIKLVEEGFYDGTKFHRVIDGFMIQGGDPNTKTPDTATYGTGGPGYAIADEHIPGENLSNVRGSISMANSGPNSGGSQFFINLTDNTFLDFDKQPLSSKHPVFGRVVEGMDVVDAIAKVETSPRDLPLEDVVIESATVSQGQ